MSASQSTLAITRGPIVDPKTGYPSRDFLKWLQHIEAKTDQTLSLDGQVIGNITGDFGGTLTDSATVQGAPASLAAQIANLDANGVVLPNGLDMSRAYVGKLTSNIPEGGTSYYAGEHGADITGNHQSATTASIGNHSQDDLPDGTKRFASSRYFSDFQAASGTAQWAKLGTWVAANTGGNALRLEFSAGAGYNSNAYQQSFGSIIVRIGNNAVAPNLSGLSWQETQSQGQALMNAKAVATGGSTAPGNLSWDIYVEYNAFAIGMWEAIYSSGASFTFSDTAASDPGAGSSTVFVGQGGQITSGDGHIVSRVRKYDPGSVLRDLFLNGYNTADDVGPGTLTEIMTIARQNAGLDGSGNLLFKSISPKTSIPSGQPVGTSLTPLNNTITLTTHGKPVLLLARVGFQNTVSGNYGIQPYFYRDGLAITNSADFPAFTVPPNANHSDTMIWPDISPAAGVHTYQLQAFASPASINTSGGTFFAWEFA